MDFGSVKGDHGSAERNRTSHGGLIMQHTAQHSLILIDLYNGGKMRASAAGGPLSRGALCHGIFGILVNPALNRTSEQDGAVVWKKSMQDTMLEI